MAIVGKAWAAVLHRVPSQPYPLAFQSTLYYNIFVTSLEEIEFYYPDLEWDFAFGVNGTQFRLDFLGNAYPTAPQRGYEDDEEAIMDQEARTESGFASGNKLIGGVLHARWTDGFWRTNDIYSGSPPEVWGAYPDANIWGETTAAPFGTGLGAGTIRHQALYYSATLQIVAPFSDPLEGEYPEPDGDTGDYDVGVEWIDVTHIFTPVDDGLGEGGGGGEAGLSDDRRFRVWGYVLDNHAFAVFRLGQSGSLVYDLTTKTWAEWQSPGRDNWRAHIGQNWIGASADTMEHGFGTDVVAGDDDSGVLWMLDPTNGRDDRTTTGDDAFPRVVVGGVQVTGRDVLDCGAVTIDLALGNPSQTGATITLEFSDDLGNTFLSVDSVTIVAGDYSPVVEWRALGQIKAPGRVFRFTDDGATVRVGGANLR